MKLKEVIDLVLKEERSSQDFLTYKVRIGEDEGENIPHFHLIGEKKKTAIMLNMPYYFLHGDKTYILNSKEKKLLVRWLLSVLIYKKGNEDEEGNLPKTNWENLKNMWNNYYPGAKIDCSMPNYNLLEKDYKKKKSLTIF